jgi:hypothetical protein
VTKAQRKIDETKSRTMFIRRVQHDAKQRQLSKLKQNSRKAAESRDVQVMFEKRKAQEAGNVFDRRRSLYEKKRDEANKLKEERKVVIQGDC